MPDNISPGRCLPPLEAVGGAPSDHPILGFTLTLPHKHSFEWVTYKARNMSTKNKEKFRERYTGIDWEVVLGSVTCPSEMTRIFHNTINTITDECFPEQTRKIRSTDDPWIDDNIRREIRRRKRCYGKRERSGRWQQLKETTDNLIREAKKNFYNDAVEKLKARGGNQVPYKILRELAVADRPRPWVVNSVKPAMTDDQLANSLADYFTKITDEFSPLGDESLPRTFSNPYKIIEPHEVASRIRSAKKSKSAVDGDILPSLANEYSDLTAIPATRIINYCFEQGTWPMEWRTETQSAIPKGESADSYDQLRNISCTNTLSKIMESFVLDKLQEETTLRPSQFGGMKGCGTSHFLIECWDFILRALDEPDSAASVLSVDFSKAFNRMSHQACVRALMDVGASTESIRMVVAFLTGRRMRFKVGSTYSSLREVRGGSPQGTKLGGFLFIATINKIEEATGGIPPEMNTSEHDGREGDENDDEDLYGLRGLVGRVSAIRRFDSGVAVASTPRKAATTDGVLRYLDRSGREESSVAERTAGALSGAAGEAESLKYIDDVNLLEQLRLSDAVSTFSHLKEKKEIPALQCGAGFKNIVQNARGIGMKVNPGKTQLVCISAALHSEVSSHVTVEEAERINSQESLTVLGFRFGSRPTMAEHMSLVTKKYNARSWVVRHLKMAGVPSEDIVQVYAATVRASIEYASTVYHTMLTSSQSEEIERMQRRCLKIIYGFRVSYREALERAGLQTLAERRSVAFCKFMRKAAGSDRFRHWFPVQERKNYDLRRPLKYVEYHANTERLYKSPLFTMRRLLNEDT